MLHLLGADYVPLSVTGTFSPANMNFQQFSLIVDIIDDSVVENTEILFLSLSSSDPAVIVDSEADQIDLTIPDNDGKVIKIIICSGYEGYAHNNYYARPQWLWVTSGNYF